MLVRAIVLLIAPESLNLAHYRRVRLEHPGVRVFTLLPGLLKTEMTAKEYLPFARDDPMLTGGMSLFLCTHRADWLRGGIMSVNCKYCPLYLFLLLKCVNCML